MTRIVRAPAAVIAAAGLFAAACGRTPPAAAPAAGEVAAAATPAAADLVVLPESALKGAGIVIEPARTITRSDQAEAPGLVALDEMHTARVGSLVEGVVVENLAQIGDRVGQNQILATLHSHAVHDAWAGYRKAVAERRRMTTELNYAVQAHERARRLFADKAIAQQDLERAAANRSSAEDELEQATAEMRRSEEELEHLGITNGEDPQSGAGEFIPVRSPIRGIVLERLVTPGTAVTPGLGLFVVSDLSRLWVLAEIDEAHLSKVKAGRPVTVKVAAYPGEPFAGTIAYVGEVVNPKTRRVTVRCQIANAGGRLKPEMFATVTLGESEPRAALVVPGAAVQSINGRNSVFIAEGPNTFRVRPVEVGPESDGLVEIKAGLTSAERIATSGAFVLKSELLKASAPPEG